MAQLPIIDHPDSDSPSTNGAAATNGATSRPRGLTIPRVFSRPDRDPFDAGPWTTRTARITDHNTGQVIFEQADVAVPEAWSQRATDVVAHKYLYGPVGTPQRETGVRRLVSRVVGTIARWGWEDGYFATAADYRDFRDELVTLCVQQYGAFNSPVWFNVGVTAEPSEGWCWDPQAGDVRAVRPDEHRPQGSACFIQSVQDNMGSIMDLAKSEAMLFKRGSGTGTDLTPLRSTYERLTGGGVPSGPVSFMRVYDAGAGVIKSGGKTRRAAKMQTLKCHHPNIKEFIECKAAEERKARALIAAGYDSSFNGEAYASVRFQNANLSVRATDQFMARAIAPDPAHRAWATVPPSGQDVETPTYDASELLDQIAEGTWLCGDPGLQYEDTIQRWHTCPNTAPIHSSNPCSEFHFIDDTACNLASINLMKFRRGDGTFDSARFRAAVQMFLIAQEILVDRASYPTAAIARNSHDFRPLGLGYANLGALIMASGRSYDSPEGRDLAAGITALMHGEAYRTSALLAGVQGPFPGFAVNREPMLRVMEQHQAAVRDIGATCPEDIRAAAEAVWDDCVRYGKAHGYRNSQATVIAPTGTIAFMMDCDTTGIEPAIALVSYKKLAGGGSLKMASTTVPMALEALGYGPEARQRIIAHIERFDTIEDVTEDGQTHRSGLDPDHLPVFDCAFRAQRGRRALGWEAHVRMMAAAQPFVSGSISKTINMNRDATAAQIRDAYVLGWRLGLKCLAIYRDGSKGDQPVSTSRAETPRDSRESRPMPAPGREKLPADVPTVRHKFDIRGHKGYLHVGFYPDGRLGEVFLTMDKEGSTVGGLADVVATLTSMALQSGVPLETLVQKFSYVAFPPDGATGDPDVPLAKSFVDWVFRKLAHCYPGGRHPGGATAMAALLGRPVPAVGGGAPEPPGDVVILPATPTGDAGPCPLCGTLMVRAGACYRCPGCGETSGCG